MRRRGRRRRRRTAGDTTAAAAAGGRFGRGRAAQAQAGQPANNLPAGPTTNLPPNELGRIMVLEYHRTGSPEGEFVRTLENFRKDLKALHDAGYRPVTMRQVLEGNIDIPRGTTPVVFTMDDATRGQFYYRPDGSMDPNTMMGSWVSFKEQNPSWGPGGMVWCILPAAAHPSNFFGETKDRDTPREQREANIRKKMEFIVQNGHEVCNHTLYHARLDRASNAQQAMDWIGIGEDSIKAYLPADYDIVTFALPLGMWPAQKSAAWQGTYRDGKRYENKVVLEVSGGPSVTPWDTRWDPHSVDRFIVAPGALERQLAPLGDEPRAALRERRRPAYGELSREHGAVPEPRRARRPHAARGRRSSGRGGARTGRCRSRRRPLRPAARGADPRLTLG